ncbi:mRNA cap guanine-N7 methyltransferase-like [Arachis ipaensis]|uniref:mRNA cap guanine-N7 methyltransferase-like n=1 Tax=Arachis ipaensis TaxID=130454 RepID=UPI0007AFA565|nr:mRNA cap guanine-N7 methyltransferase-like [Arachis ipaensis]
MNVKTKPSPVTPTPHPQTKPSRSLPSSHSLALCTFQRRRETVPPTTSQRRRSLPSSAAESFLPLLPGPPRGQSTTKARSPSHSQRRAAQHHPRTVTPSRPAVAQHHPLTQQRFWPPTTQHLPPSHRFKSELEPEPPSQVTNPGGRNRDRKTDLLVIADRGNSFKVINHVSIPFLDHLFLDKLQYYTGLPMVRRYST